MLRSFRAVLFVFLLLVPLVVVGADERTDTRVMVLPFDGASSGNFSYLTDSIRGMISTRIAAQDGIEIVDYSVKAEELGLLSEGQGEAKEETFFSKFNTDYVISGALYELTTGLKIQVTLSGKDLDGVRGKFSALAVNESKIIESVEGLVQDIVAKGIGYRIDDFSVTAKDTAGDQGLAGFSTEHPERLFKRGIYGGSIVADEGVAVKALGVRRSSLIPTMIVGMAVHDLDGDGTLEIVAASRTELEIYQFDETRFRKLAGDELGKRTKVHAVNVADLNGDGVMEIVLSANSGDRVASSIYNWRASSGLTPLAKNVRYYLRPIEIPGEGLVLAGQRGSKSQEDGYVQAGISRMMVEEGYEKMREGKRVALPQNTSLFDFIWADLDGDGGSELITVDRREKILVFDSGNSLTWVSEEEYGGSRNFFGPTISSVKDFGDLVGGDQEEDFDREISFIPTRLIAKDLDGDGGAEIIVGQNIRAWSKWLGWASRSREYDGGSVACLKWQDGGLNEQWKTNKINGYVADYGLFAPGAGDTLQLYVSQVPDRMMFGFLMNADSKLLRYELELLQQ